MIGTSFREDSAKLGRYARLEHPEFFQFTIWGCCLTAECSSHKFVQGSRLDEYVSHINSLSGTASIFQTVCETVAFAHSHGVIHRDLKPQKSWLVLWRSAGN